MRRAEPDHRWIVAVHEAGHYEAARHYKARRPKATVTRSARKVRGLTTVHRWTGSYLDEVVYHLAGSAAARLITGYPGLAGSDDLPKARKVCRTQGINFADAERLAAAFARTHRGDIERAADRLYREGRI